MGGDDGPCSHVITFVLPRPKKIPGSTAVVRDVQCPIDRVSYTQPLMTLLGAQGDRVGQQGIKIW